VTVQEKARESAAPDAAKLARLATMAMLWVTLTGSLGMLLQAIARERANRALESLLASAQAWEIVTGKLLGVGAISLLILLVWLGSTAASAAFLPPQSGMVGAVLLELARPWSLLRDALIYICAFGFFGAATLVLGAVARDGASAQNLARPLFLVLLAAFFVALGALQNSALPSWLIYVPPFTPFLLLVNSASDVAAMSQAILLGMLIAASAGLMLLAARFLSVSPGFHQIFKGNPPQPQPLV
jgi:ABC-2 type transport system permease protein